jgi:hypothetical protein
MNRRMRATVLAVCGVLVGGVLPNHTTAPFD